VSCPTPPFSRYQGLFERAQATQQLLSAHLELTRRCHLDCTMCYQAAQSHAHEELTTAEWLAVLAELRRLGTLFVLLSGGELFLRRDALTLAAAVRDQGMALRLATTGTLLDEERCRAIAALYPSAVELTVLSLDPAAHDAVTRTPGSLAQTLAGLRRLRALSVPVQIKTPLVRRTWPAFAAVRELARQLGASHSVDPALTSRDDGDRGTLADRLDDGELEAFFRQEAGETLPGPFALEQSTCMVGRNFLVVGPHGDVVPCVSLPVTIGNVRRDRLGDLWAHHPFLQELRGITYRSLPTCGGCARSGYCGRCPGMALLEDGDLYGPSSFACRSGEAQARAQGSEAAAAPAPARPAARREASGRLRLAVLG
jgi:radical SAM protein with 4Fe4S-binding SPASM domain